MADTAPTSDFAATDFSPAQVSARYRAVLSAIGEAAAKAGRPPGSVELVAVSKTQSVAKIRALLELGHRRFGENRVQEAEQKWPELKREFPDAILHLIGPLQTNKVRAAVALFDVIETVDRERLAQNLTVEMTRADKRPECLVEINIGAEPQKAGALPDVADAFIADCRARLALPVTGLMCIPPEGRDAAPFFARLAAMAAAHKLPVLSMGMSADYPLAIANGATRVRVGTALFGKR